MKKTAEKLQTIESDLSQEHGEFELFALFLREDSPDKWDLIISSDWARADKKTALNILVSKMESKLEPKELLMLSRIIILNKDDASLNALHSGMQVEHGLAEISDSNFFGLAIKHAFLITSKRLNS
jgi:hypothetical protein